MEKLRLELEALQVESFDAGDGARSRGTIRAHDDSDCSQAYTCGMASRGEQTYEALPLTRYACCV